MTDPTKDSATNQLAAETSPYLRQHADNPVHWLPWGPRALALAAAQDKPIVLSVGYSACHWCHVMAHESFADADTAQLMNEGFINIKVDREERPDLDHIYQFAHQMLTQQPGGWPLTMFLTPDRQIPFFGGTYFPNEARHGMPALRDILKRVREFYSDHRDDIDSQSNAILEVFRQTDPKRPAGVKLTDIPLDAARQALLSEFDAKYGGFGGAPKFPTPGNLTRLMRYWHAHSAPPSPDLQSLFMATRTLQSMALGGLCDQIGGGFFRYSVDAHWAIPHFEKMLYDNAGMLALYAQTYRATGDKLFWRVANETADFLLRDMRDENGGFYAALDADSDGTEGAFYVWDREELRAVLGANYDAASRYYGFQDGANFESQWHLYVADDSVFEDDAGQEKLGAIKARLFAARATRTAPFRDTKILTSWNGMAIRALAIAGRHLERDDLTQAAIDAADFIRNTMFRDRRLLAVYAGDSARLNGYLDDYAFVLDALLELMQTRFRTVDLDFATALADSLIEHFHDSVDGGFFFTSDDHEQVIHRMKPIADNATQSGNGVAARALLRLGHLLGENRYIDAARGTVEAAWEPINHVPHGHAAVMDALEEYLTEPQIVVIRAAADDLTRWLTPTKSYAPRRQVYAIADNVDNLPELLATRAPQPGGVAYVCQGQTCGLPIDTPQALLAKLQVAAEPATT